MSHTVMVTGADGFIGSHLAEELVKSGEKVRAFCLYNSFGSLGWIDTLPRKSAMKWISLWAMCVTPTACVLPCAGRNACSIWLP